jgi:gamma-butyrobetaine dioxygenase
VHARFSDGHDETFDATDLAVAIDPDDGCPDPGGVDLGARDTTHATTGATWITPAALEAALHDFLRYGTIVVHDTPTTEGTVLEVAERFGHVRTTNFGRLFDVRSIPQPQRPGLHAGAARAAHRQPVPHPPRRASSCCTAW